MKKLFFLLLVTFFLLNACQQDQNQILIKGNLSNVTNNKLYLAVITPDGITTIDSGKIKNGHFEFKIKAHSKEEEAKLKDPVFYQLYFTPYNALTTLAKEGDVQFIQADAQNLAASYTITGSEDAKLLWELEHSLTTFIQYTDSLQKIYNFYIENDSIRTEIEASYNQIVEKHTDYLRKFIEKNNGSFASITAFYQTYNKKSFFDEEKDIPLLKYIASHLEKKYTHNENVNYLKKRIEIAEMRKNYYLCQPKK
ncbi:MAG: DUF4369 domain-containing protein [Bacteroidales bacterium]